MLGNFEVCVEWLLSTTKKSPYTHQVPSKLDQGVQFYRPLNKVLPAILLAEG